MILCAGLGTRLRPWTLSHPKALVPVNGVPMLKRVVDELSRQGFDEIVLNVHHFSSQIVAYVEEGNLDTRRILISDESEQLLDTGGGILNAAPLLGSDGNPFLVHNVDILSNADLKALFESHVASHRDVTLLVSDRKSDRRLVFDSNMVLKGWINMKTSEKRPASFEIAHDDRLLAFSGIYVMSVSVFDAMRRHGYEGKFPIMDFFLAGLPGVRIGGVCQEGLEILDIGKPDTLHRANLLLQ